MSSTNCLTHKQLAAIIDERGPQQSFWETRYFGNTILSEADEVIFDIRDDDMEEMAEFVSCCMPGVVVKDRAPFKRLTFSPPNIKIKSMIDPCSEKNVMQPGEIQGNEFTDSQKVQQAITRVQSKHERLISKRKEWMAAMAVINGEYFVRGDHVESVLVNFGRDASHTVALAGAAAWDQTTATPVTNIEDWGTTMFQAKGGSAPADMFVGKDTWNAMRRHQEVNDLMDKDVASCDEGQNCVTKGPVIVDEKSVTLVGRISGINIWLYKSFYTDEAGVKQQFLADNELVLVGDGFQGWTLYGAISDLNQMGPARLFQKSWEENDPSGLCMLSQSRPMMIVPRPNSSFKATVL